MIEKEEERDPLDTFEVDREQYFAERPVPKELADEEPIVGARELNDYGKWIVVENVTYWQPTVVEAGWAPFASGTLELAQLRLELGAGGALGVYNLPLRKLELAPELRLGLVPGVESVPRQRLLGQRRRLHLLVPAQPVPAALFPRARLPL